MVSKNDAPRFLAAMHFDVEDGLRHVFRLWGAPQAESREAEAIKLLEVHEGTVAAGIMPHFGPTPHIPYPR